MAIIDIVFLIILAGFIFYGLFFGLIRTFGSLFGIAAGLWLSFIFYPFVFSWVENLFFGHEMAGKIVIFFVLFALINRFIGFVFALLDRTFDLLSVIPFLKTINRLAGSVLGFVEGGLVLGLILIYAGQFFPAGWLNGSQAAPFLIKFAGTVLRLLPGLINMATAL